MASEEREIKNKRLALRITPRQREVISEAAQASDQDLSSFVLESALSNAHHVLADRRIFSLSPAGWKRFNELLDRPTTPLSTKPKLEELLVKPSALER